MSARMLGPKHIDIRRICGGWLALTLLACGPEERTAPEPPPVQASIASNAGSKIAFQSNRDGDIEIYAMNPDGSSPTRLTTSPGRDANPDWSPGGLRLAFASYRDDPTNSVARIYVMNADGSSQVALTDDPAGDGDPEWSPDGTLIAFTRSESAGDIWVMNADGSNERQLTTNAADDFNTSWSSDGERIAFTSERDGDFDIFIMNADGANQVNLTHAAGIDLSPSFSPDGKYIAFQANRQDGDGTSHIYIMQANGSHLRQLTTGAPDFIPTWSPDGKRIAFNRATAPGETDEINIFSVRFDGTDLQQLTTGTARNRFPDWSDGAARRR
jgi:Tol biopolymer transport system component